MQCLLVTMSNKTEASLESSERPQVSQDNCGATLVGDNLPSKIEENMHELSEELQTHNIGSVVMQLAQNKDVIYKIDSVPGEVVEQLVVAESYGVIMNVAQNNILEQHQAMKLFRGDTHPALKKSVRKYNL